MLPAGVSRAVTEAADALQASIWLEIRDLAFLEMVLRAGVGEV